MGVLSELDVDLPATWREHFFGYQDGITQVCVEGTGVEPPPGSGYRRQARRVRAGVIPTRRVPVPTLPHPEWLTRNGSFLAYRRLYQDVAAFREFLRQNAPTRDEQELLAAKLMGRWRSGAPLVLAPRHDDPDLVADPQRSNNFDYGQMDPRGLACPIGAHIRRVNPRDTITNMRRRLIRTGLPYGPPLLEESPDDGVDRGLAVFFGCADLERQFEFIQKEWINAPKFQGLLHDKDLIAGDHDGTYNMTIQHKPIKKTLHGLPRFTTVKGGAYVLLPGLRALRSLANAWNQHASGSVSESGTLIALMRYQRGSLSRPGKGGPGPGAGRGVEGPVSAHILPAPPKAPLTRRCPRLGWWCPLPAGAVRSAWLGISPVKNMATTAKSATTHN